MKYSSKQSLKPSLVKSDEAWAKQIDSQINHYNLVVKSDNQFETLKRAAIPVPKPPAPILGRDLGEFRLKLRNPEKANVILLGDPGSGKTAFIQGFTYHPESASYLVLAVDIERLLDNDDLDKDTGLANGLWRLIEEVKRYSMENNVIIILFMDEFHRLPMLSPSAVEALKPILEKSAQEGFRVVGSTTFEEFNQFIANNRALDQRMLRESIPELKKDAVLDILRSRADLYGMLELADPNVFEDIYNHSRSILISNAQPRASIDILLSMIGNAVWEERMVNGKLERVYATPEQLGMRGDTVLNRTLLNRVIRRSYGIDIDNQISVRNVRETLEKNIFNQSQAINSVMTLLERMLVGFTKESRPKISFLSTGPTGTGKTEMAKQITSVLGIPLKRFDMSRYPRPEDAVAFADDLANAAWSAPNAYILIDEAEKSTKEAMNILLQVLDDARLTAANNPNRVISFTGTIINLTTNLGSENYRYMQRFGDENAPIDIEVIYKSLKAAGPDGRPRFETAVLGRLDTIVPFVGLPTEALEHIAERELENNLSVIETYDRQVYISPDVIPYIVQDRTSGDTERGGARDIARNIANIVLAPVATYLATEPMEVPISIYVKGTPRFKNKDVGDPLSGELALMECLSLQEVETWLEALGQKVGAKLYYKNLFIPKNWTPQEFANQFVPLIRNGVRTFTSIMDGEKTIIIKG